MNTPILAFLQNTWVRDVPRCEAILAGMDAYGRRRVQEAWLFMGCLTGQRLKAVFGDDEVYRITWDNASPRLAGRSSGNFPPDTGHIKAALDEVQPKIVLAFGKVAEAGVRPLWRGPLIVGPHPAARAPDTLARLRSMVAELERLERCPL